MQVGLGLLVQRTHEEAVVVAAHGVARALGQASPATVQNAGIRENTGAGRSADGHKARFRINELAEVCIGTKAGGSAGRSMRAGHDVGAAVGEVELRVTPDDERTEGKRRIGHGHAALIDMQLLQAAAGVNDGAVRATEAKAFAHDLGEQAIHQRPSLRRRFLELHCVAEHGTLQHQIRHQLGAIAAACHGSRLRLPFGRRLIHQPRHLRLHLTWRHGIGDQAIAPTNEIRL